MRFYLTVGLDWFFPGTMFKSTEMSEVLTEIVKMEPTFELNTFLKRVQYDIIPNVLEALSVGEIEILKDWCTETVCPMTMTTQRHLTWSLNVFVTSRRSIS